MKDPAPGQAWLLRDDEVLAAIEIADSFRARLRGLLGRDGIEGGVLLRPAKSVHTIGMRFPLDVAFCAKDLTVLEVTTMGRFRVGLPRLKAHCVIEAERGAFERWRLQPGDRLEIKG
ncbi:MAG: uncharacterized protein QOE35_3655 [Actinomycetota bacterium]